MDFITQLPFSNNFYSILEVVERFSKIAIFIPTYGAIMALSLAQIFINHDFSKHGLPASIVRDRGLLFVPSFWTQLCQQLKVWLASKNTKTTRPTKKLSERWLGPFEVLKKIGSHAYHLKFPQQWKSVHPVFHVSLIRPLKQSTSPNQHQLPQLPVIVEEKYKWELAQALDSKLKRGKLWYLVEWKGFIEYQERTTWEPAFNLTSSPDIFKDFHSFYPDKPVPIASRV
ncbi:hypothetical protein O181_079228 [Austropuccinia psidii MF-1]|uniref:Chromo domain-containing protein n=1 Tax=Austropuccinia psidii MF-1 TaxID=1389203 RepID=A0A9Q3IFE5_9BASI|nr:hypothetical protein [Austropuccinia psidii MF-1]